MIEKLKNAIEDFIARRMDDLGKDAPDVVTQARTAFVRRMGGRDVVERTDALSRSWRMRSA